MTDEASNAAGAVLDADAALSLHEVMLRIRHFELRAGELFAAGQLPGFIHLSIGQEAVAAGVCAALSPDDYMTTTHRGHGHCIAKGAGLSQMMAELFGREGGHALGRSGSMHIADSTAGILGANAIVGGGLPMAVGGGLATQLDGHGRVSIAFFGDGAVAQGVMHECLNLASLWRLPVVFVCENNGLAELTPSVVHLANTDVVAFAEHYGLVAERVDGNDVAAVTRAATAAVARARKGAGPSLIEARTTRLRGHFEGDPQRYRSREELEDMKGEDPIARCRKLLERDFDVSASTLDAMEERAAGQVETAVRSAMEQAPSDPAGLTRHVYPPKAKRGDQ